MGTESAISRDLRAAHLAGNMRPYFRTHGEAVPWEPVECDSYEDAIALEKMRRYFIGRAIDKSPALQHAITERCSVDPVFWCNTFVWSLDPLRADGNAVPFVLFEFQRLFFLFLVCRAPGSIGADGKPVKMVLEKGRELGATYVCLIAWMWLWLFRPATKLGVVSRTGSDVWDKTEDSLFGKLKYIYNHLPHWLRPGDWESLFTASPKVSLIHPRSGSVILGSKTTVDVFRGGRHLRIFCDEWASVPRAAETARSINGATDGAVLVSTPKGRGNHYSRVTHGEEGLLTEPGQDGPGWRLFRFHFRDDKRKGPQWEDKKRAEVSSEEFEQEHNLSYEAGQPGRYWPGFHPSIHVLRPDEWKEVARELFHVGEYGSVQLQPGISIVGAHDFGLFCSCVMGAFNKPKNELFILGGWTWYDQTVEEMAAVIEAAGYSVNGGPGLPVHWVGDPAGNQRQRARVVGDDARTWIADYKGAGIDIKTKRVRFKESMNLIRRALKPENIRLWFSPGCARRTDPKRLSVVECAIGYRAHLPQGSPQEFKISGEAPKHGGEESHTGDTIRYLASHIWDETKVGLQTLKGYGE